MSMYEININGCDDSTVLEIELTKDEASLIEKIAKMSKAQSIYGCMPTIELLEVKK